MQSVPLISPEFVLQIRILPMEDEQTRTKPFVAQT